MTHQKLSIIEGIKIMTEPIEIKNCEDDDILDFNDEICKVRKFRKVTKDYFYSDSSDYVEYICEKLDIRELEISKPVNMRGRNYKYITNNEWFIEGKECQILQEGKRWKKGKLRVKLTLEFIPDEPEVSEENSYDEIDNIIESPLDEIRQQLTEESKS